MISRDIVIGLVVVAALTWADWALLGYLVASWAKKGESVRLSNEVAALEALAESRARAARLWEDRYLALVQEQAALRLAELADA